MTTCKRKDRAFSGAHGLCIFLEDVQGEKVINHGDFPPIPCDRSDGHEENCKPQPDSGNYTRVCEPSSGCRTGSVEPVAPRKSDGHEENCKPQPDSGNYTRVCEPSSGCRTGSVEPVDPRK
ncbi:Hypothetical predicted protein [Olea europaea subsp. europaea]|uniref:Uncharacterized protein n=1 Tax=Olea europaea subsp. europaea TaxID=158383 RepID=A0A8S0PIA5_OLEEU|nr:Hypothetical predicted protein [Olea europaea subsp. europaea]